MAEGESTAIEINEDTEGEMTPLIINDEHNSVLKILSQPVEKLEYRGLILTEYVTPTLLYKEQISRAPKDTLPDKVQLIREAIENVLISGHEDVSLGAATVSFRNGQMSLCGSTAEGTKVGKPDEFDFQFLINIDSLSAKPKALLRTKPRSSNLEGRSYFSLTMPDRGFETVEIKASAIHDAFLNIVSRVLPNVLEEYEVKKAGPAVKIFFIDDNGIRTKIDMTLGIRADPYEIPHLSSFAKALLEKNIFKCHFVAAHDYWKICFVEIEQLLMDMIIKKDQVKGAVYRIIKLLRDDADIKDAYGDGILPSYPIKVTFMDIALVDHRQDKQWFLQDVAAHVIRILLIVEKRGQNHSLNSLFLENEEVMGEADRSYLESRRLLKELRLKDNYYNWFRMTTLLQILFYLLATLVLVFAFPNFKIPQAWSRLTAILYGVYIILNLYFVIRNIYFLAFGPKTHFLKIYPFQALFSLTVLAFELPLFMALVVDLPTNQTAQYFLLAVVTLMTYSITATLCTAISSCVDLCRNTTHSIEGSMYHMTRLLPFKWRPPKGDPIPYISEYGSLSRMRAVYQGLSSFSMLVADIACIGTLFYLGTLQEISDSETEDQQTIGEALRLPFFLLVSLQNFQVAIMSDVSNARFQAVLSGKH